MYDNSDWLLAGKVSGAYGIKGWVRVYAFTDPIDNLLQYSQWQLRHPASYAQRRVEQPRDKDKRNKRHNTSHQKLHSEQHTTPAGSFQKIELREGRRQGKGLIVSLVGINDRTQAEALRGAEIWMPSSELPELGEEEYYWHQLQGLRVWCHRENEHLLLGEIDHLLETGANDVMVLKACEGSIDGRERLIPYLPGQVVTSIDLDDGRMLVDWHPDD